MCAHMSSFASVNPSFCSTAVRPRHYLGRDETLDYEVMSDLDWEEEPEGEERSWFLSHTPGSSVIDCCQTKLSVIS